MDVRSRLAQQSVLRRETGIGILRRLAAMAAVRSTRATSASADRPEEETLATFARSRFSQVAQLGAQ